MDRFVPLSEVTLITGMSRSTIYDYVAAGIFPRPAKIGTASRWSRQEIADWMNARLSERNSSTEDRAQAAA